MAPPNDLQPGFADRFRIVNDPVMLAVERRVLGSDYGASSYTTRDQADELARCLRLTPNSRLLDVGSGPGWPGNYLAASTGCTAVVTDPTPEGMAVAEERARRDRLSGSRVVATGNELPFRDGAFDAITSSDVY